ncbi:hypothetical protein [Nocardia sp. NPDC005998]|uniref:hypothetical protein n=1 Tax=Nocardia sp. NPDC005998 TaxID=3156894 RepID=UPI0033B099EA
MTSVVPATKWDLSLGTAAVFPSRNGIVRPFILVGDSAEAAVDPNAFAKEIDSPSPDYSFRAMLNNASYDLILVCLSTSDSLDGKAYDSLRSVITRTINYRNGGEPLTVCGIGRGALQLRYLLARTEAEGIDHQARCFLSYYSTEPSKDEAAELNRVGSWPRLPRMYEIGITGDNFNYITSDFDDLITGARANRVPLFPDELSTNILEKIHN